MVIIVMPLRLCTQGCANMENMQALQMVSVPNANSTPIAPKMLKLLLKQQPLSVQAVMCAKKVQIISS
jgi:hypothetical protein